MPIRKPRAAKASNRTPELLRTEHGGGAHTTWCDAYYAGGVVRRTIQLYSGGEPSDIRVKWFRDTPDALIRRSPPDWARFI